MKRLFFSILLLSLSAVAIAQEEKEDHKSSYTKRIEGYQSFWSKLTPSHIKVQYAGSMGFLSFGTGWDYGGKVQWETDLFVRFVPKYSTDKVKITMTLRQNLIPWNVKLGKKGLSFDPFAIGVYVTTIFGNQFWASSPDYYPDSYKRFSTKFRINGYLGQRLTLTRPTSKRIFAKSYTLYYEISTSEIHAYEFLTNKSIGILDCIGLSFGLKIQLF